MLFLVGSVYFVAGSYPDAPYMQSLMRKDSVVKKSAGSVELNDDIMGAGAGAGVDVLGGASLKFSAQQPPPVKHGGEEEDEDVLVMEQRDAPVSPQQVHPQ